MINILVEVLFTAIIVAVISVIFTILIVKTNIRESHYKAYETNCKECHMQWNEDGIYN